MYQHHAIQHRVILWMFVRIHGCTSIPPNNGNCMYNCGLVDNV